ncbi:MAG: efflux RND transporter periplasmic adaptor subunit [Candidatus Binatia bacterium]
MRRPFHHGARPVRLGACLALLLLASSCGEPKPGGPAGSDGSAILVDMATVETRDIDVTLEAVGTAYASGQVDIRPQVSGTLLAAPFVEGQDAEEGQVLARIDDGKARASLALAHAQLDSARAKVAVATERLGRFRRLAAEELVSREEYATLESEQKAAAAAVRENEAEVRLAERNLEDFTLKAPITGRMGIRYVDVGNFIEAGTVLATLVATDPLEVLITVPSTAVRGLEVGQEAGIRDTDPSRTLLGQGRIRVIDPRVDTDTRMVSVKVLVPNPDEKIKAGQFVAVSLVRESRPGAIVVPEDAVLPQAGKAFVFVVKDGLAARREIVLGERLPEMVEVTSGLSAGETIVTRGQHRLSEGVKVAQQQGPKDAAPPKALPDEPGRG